MRKQRQGETFKVNGPGGRIVHVRFFDDGSVKIQLIKASPMVIRYAFLPGRGKNTILELTPIHGSVWANPG